MRTDFYILVEGPDDHRFFSRVLRSAFSNLGIVHIVETSRMKRSYFSALMERIKSDAVGYLFVHDFDHAICVPARKDDLREKHPEVELERMMIVVQEIESWYMAGLTQAQSQKLQIPVYGQTDDLTKGRFEDIVSSNFGTVKLAKLSLLEAFSVDEARKNNTSFEYLFRKFIPPN